MYIISGEFKVRDESRDELVEISLKLIPHSLKEPGCLSHGFFEDLERPGYFLFFERWKSRADIAAHFEEPYFKDFAEKFPAMIEGEATIEIHEVASTESM